MKIINLKTLPRWYNDVVSGRKTFEVRKDDKDFQVGDLLILQEYDGDYTGSEYTTQITYILGRDEDEKKFVPDGYVVLGIE